MIRRRDRGPDGSGELPVENSLQLYTDALAGLTCKANGCISASEVTDRLRVLAHREGTAAALACARLLYLDAVRRGKIASPPLDVATGSADQRDIHEQLAAGHDADEEQP